MRLMLREIAERWPASAVYVSYQDDNAVARHLYESIGFREVERVGGKVHRTQNRRRLAGRAARPRGVTSAASGEDRQGKHPEMKCLHRGRQFRGPSLEKPRVRRFDSIRWSAAGGFRGLGSLSSLDERHRAETEPSEGGRLRGGLDQRGREGCVPVAKGEVV